MTTNEQMTIDEVYKYLRLMKPRCRQASRQAQGRLLDEMEQVTGRHRKSLIRLLHSDLQRQRRRRERGRTYKRAVAAALRVIWESYDYICAERLQPNLVPLAEQLAAHAELELSAPLKQQLGQIKLTTVRERLKRFRQDEPQRQRRPPGPRNQGLADIPTTRLRVQYWKAPLIEIFDEQRRPERQGCLACSPWDLSPPLC